jgi:hypothetical protein
MLAWFLAVATFVMGALAVVLLAQMFRLLRQEREAHCRGCPPSPGLHFDLHYTGVFGFWSTRR